MMIRGRTTAAICSLLTAATTATLAQSTMPADRAPISPGITLSDNGVIDIGDAYVEVNYYDAAWTIAQQHDRFAPTATTKPSDADRATTIRGTLTTAGGPATYVERVEPTADGVKLSATFDSEKPLATNEISMTFILPLKSFGGRTMSVDGKAVELPMTPAKKGEARIFEQAGVHAIELPTPTGTLSVTGDFALLLNDDREWNDPRYSLRLCFTPPRGTINHAAIDLTMKLTPTAKP